MLKRLLPNIDPRVSVELWAQRNSIRLGLICSGISSLLFALYSLLAKKAVNDLQQGNSLVWVALAVVALFSVKYVFTWGQTYFLTEAGTMLTAELRKKLYAKLQRLPMSFFNEKRSGAIQSVLTNDINVFQNAIGIMRDVIDGPIKIVVGLGILIYISPAMAGLLFALFPLMWFVINRNARKVKGVQAQVQTDLSDLTAMMQESLQGTRIVKAFGAEKTMMERFSDLIHQSVTSQLKLARRTATLKPMVELIGGIAIGLVFLMCGFLVQKGLFDLGKLVGFLAALDTINQGGRNLGSLKQTGSQLEAAADRIYREVLDAPETISDVPDALVPSTSRGQIEFRNVSFTYPDGTEALRNVSFTIQPGTSLALVGPSGSGKSTIADLLLRFSDPTDGVILYDGVDVRKLQVHWYRGQIGVVPQQTFLFAGTIADNLRLAKPDATDDDIHEALIAAHALEFIEEMPNGSLTTMGERGVRLSGGQGQRIAIARALVRKPTVLLMDEATSNLDPISEKMVQQALDEIMHTRTSLFIAHRLTTAARADRILMLKSGETVEIGSFDELMKLDGAFAMMYRAFSGGALDDNILG